MKRSTRALSEYCPHRPDKTGQGFNARMYWIGGHFSIHVGDFQSTLDGVVAYAVFFSFLFLSSFTDLPTAGLAERYRDSLLRTGLVTVAALAVILLYMRFGAKRALQSGPANAKRSLLASVLVLLIWATTWVFFGEISGTFRLVTEPARIGLVPLAFCIGLLDGLAVYACCTERFVSGLGRTIGILISSLFGWLLFVAASVDSALYLLPILAVLAYVSVRTGSPLGPTLATGLLLGFFYVYFGQPPWMLGSRQAGYWLMTLVSAACALVAWLSLRRIPLGGVSCGHESTI